MVLVVPRKLPVDRTLPGTLGREDINDGFGRLRTGQAIWQMVTMGDQGGA